MNVLPANNGPIAPAVRVMLMTTSTPGAVAMLQLHGSETAKVLQALTGRASWPAGNLMLVDFAGIDSGLAVLLRDDWAQLMPHGGLQVVRRLIAKLVALGCVVSNDLSPRELYPEAASDIEADMLLMSSRAASPAAIDLLLNQPEIWRARCSAADFFEKQTRDAVVERSRVLERLITPPSIVVIGQPNVGKSTLTNRMLGRAASIVADLPGTTRDWVAGLAELPPGIAVRWMDTPGLRDSDDVIEQRAIELANQIIREADVVIVMRDPHIDWPDAKSLPRRPDVWVMNKSDIFATDNTPAADGESCDTPLRISAECGEGVDVLSRVLIEKLGLAKVDANEPWAFSERLQLLVHEANWRVLREYGGL